MRVCLGLESKLILVRGYMLNMGILGSGVGFLSMKIEAKSNGDVSGYVLLFRWSDWGPHGHK